MIHDISDPKYSSDITTSGLRRRAWPVAVSAAFIVAGMAYSLFWAPVVRHHPYWITPGDLWATYRGAHVVGWGDLGGVYGAGTGLVTFPGILLIFAPVAMLSGGLGLSESFPKFLPHPAAWAMLGPYEMLLSTLAIFACDALAERLGVSRLRRVILCLVEASVLWNVSVLWGHPEDAVAVGLALYSLVFAFDGRWVGAGWLFGAAMATQPLVLLMLPIMFALGGRREVVGFATRSFIPFVALVITPLVSQFHATAHALLEQPNFPGIDHVTPWTSLAPVISGSGRNITVAAGPGRIVALALACALGFLARRWRHDPERIVWAAATALALRCFTESVMVGFYIWPALAVGLIVSCRFGRTRLALAIAGATVGTAASQWHLGWLSWWIIVTAGIVIVLAVAMPVRQRSSMTGTARDLLNLSRDRESPSALVGAVQ